MKVPSLALVFLLCILAVALVAGQQNKGGEATATATATATAKSDGSGSANAVATSEAKASAGTDGSKAVNPDALVAWRAFISKCANKNYNPKLTSPRTCGILSGNLCSRKDVKCGPGKTEFLDASGNVIARGDDVSGTLS